MKYEINPIDTSQITLPDDILALTEELARNIHEVWSAQRIETGWIYGPKRDDVLKQHPNLVPYESLSEEDKDLDRFTAMETLKTIIKIGYTISKNT